MGTNYYLHENVCSTCGRSSELHIGKSSAGWVFALHVIPELGLNTLNDWEKRWTGSQAGVIKDEYGSVVTPADMMANIVARSFNRSVLTQTWLDENHAEIGPSGLARSKVYGIHCIGHGEGTWDYIGGEFS